MNSRKLVKGYLVVNGKVLQISSSTTLGSGHIHIWNQGIGVKASISYGMHKPLLISCLKQLVEWLER